MDISHSVAEKLKEDSELLGLLRAAKPEGNISRALMVILNTPPMPAQPEGTPKWKAAMSPEEGTAYLAKVGEVVEEARQGLSQFPGITVYNLMQMAGCASISGTAGDLVKFFEMGCVKSVIIGDRPIIRPAMGGRQ